MADRFLGARTNDEPGPPTLGIDPSQARHVLSSTTSWGAHARLWVAPAADGRRCLVLQLDEPSAIQRGFSASGGGVCGASRPPRHDPISVRLSWIPVNDGFAIVVTGSVAAGITQVGIRSSAGEAALPLSGGHYFGELPRTAKSGSLPAGSNSYVLIGYDGAGNEVVRLDLDQVVERSRPPS
jgi:hypothetical protein